MDADERAAVVADERERQALHRAIAGESHDLSVLYWLVAFLAVAVVLHLTQIRRRLTDVEAELWEDADDG